MKRSGRTVSLCGVFAALGVLLLSLGALIPAATFCCPVLASSLLIVLLRECGARASVTAFFATAILGVLLCPDPEIAALYLALGYYPLLQRRFDKLPGAARWLCKLLWFNGSALAVYAALIFVFRLDGLMQELSQTGTVLLAVTLLLAELVFILYDLALKRLAAFYERRRRSK